MTTAERYVRMCEDHNVEVLEEPPPSVDQVERNAWKDVLWCPGRPGPGGRAHPVNTWVNFDRVRGEVIDRASVKKGHETEVRRKLQVDFTPQPAAHEEDDMPRGIPGSAPAAKSKAGAARTIDSRKYQAGEAAVLRLHMREMGKDPASKFRITWVMTVREGKALNETKGTAHVATTEAEIQEAWKMHLAGLHKTWTLAPERSIDIREIPAPPKAAR